MTCENSSESRRCGRATRSRAPCRNTLGPGEFACRAHATEHDRERADAYRLGWKEGFGYGYDSGKQSAHFEIEKKAKEEADAAAFRLRDHAGRQIVVVGGRYAYLWAGDEPLEVGDLVELPGTWLSPDGWVSTVTGLGSSYTGSLSFIRGRVPVSSSTESNM